MVAGAGSANPSPTDAELLEAARLGSPRGFERLVERHYGTIYAVAYARTAHREAAEDLAQEVFLRGWLCLKDLRESARFLPWLVRITHNLSTNWQRRQRLVPMVSAPAMSATASAGEAPNGLESVADQHTPDPRVAAVESERERAVRQAILSLPPEQREAILLHYMEDLSQREIAQRLDTHPVAVHRLLQRGLKGMEKSLEPLIRETVPTLRPTRRAVASTVAVIAATTALSIPAKSALAAAEAGIAKAAAVSLAGAGGAATAAGGAGSAASTSFFGLLKTVITSLVTGAKIMGTGKTIGIVAAVAAIAGGGVYYFSDSQSQGLDVTPEEAREIKAAFSNYQDAVKQGDQKSMENAWDWEATARYKKSDIATAKKEVGFPVPPTGFSGFDIDSIVTSGAELEGYRNKNNWLPAGKIARVTSGNWDWYLRQTPNGWKFLIQETTNFRSNYR